jgi:hypothetical protein
MGQRNNLTAFFVAAATKNAGNGDGMIGRKGVIFPRCLVPPKR